MRGPVSRRVRPPARTNSPVNRTKQAKSGNAPSSRPRFTPDKPDGDSGRRRAGSGCGWNCWLFGRGRMDSGATPRAVSARIKTGRNPVGPGQAMWPATISDSEGKDRSGGRVHGRYVVDLRIRRRAGRLVVVAHIGVLTNTRDGLLSGDLTRQETVHASADHERLFVLKVQPRQYAKLGRCPIRHGADYGDRGSVVDA